MTYYSCVPARPISEGAAPCPDWLLRPIRFTSALTELEKKIYIFKQNFFLHSKNRIAALCFQTADVKILVLADLCPCFHQSPTKLCPDLVSFACRIVTEFWSFTRKSLPHSAIRTLNCARFCVVCALNCARILVVRALDCAQFCTLPFSETSRNTV